MTSVPVAAAAIDATFRNAMRVCGVRGGPGLRERHPPKFAVILVDFRTSLAWPERWISRSDFAEVSRYQRVEDSEGSLAGAVERGALEQDSSGAFRASAAGHAFIDDLYATQDRILGELWAGEVGTVRRLARVLADLVAAAARAAVEPGCFHAMEPAFEPAGIDPGVLVLNRLSALRYARSDAHAAAWRAAGLTAAQMVELQSVGGDRRDAIEERTNELVAPVFAGVDLAALVDDLNRLPLANSD